MNDHDAKIGTDIYRALNLTQLAKVTGYNRVELGRILRPYLIGGKIRLCEFERIMEKRQDAIEAAQARPPAHGSVSCPSPEDVTRAHPLAAELFYGPRRRASGTRR